jgi:hypothetical protein
MLVADLITTFYPRAETNLRDADRIMALLEKIAARGYILRHDAAGQVASSPFAGVSPAIQEAIRRFGDKRDDTLVVEFQGEIIGTLGIDGSQPGIYLMTQDSAFQGDDVATRRYEEWIDLAMVVYHVWRPWYGYQSSPNGSEPVTSREAALQGQLAWLYDVNLFSSELAMALGGERLAQTPAWRISSLEDGGVLIAPTAYGQGDPRYTRQQVADYLRLPYHPPTYAQFA